MLKLDLTHQTKKFLEKLPPKQFRQVVDKVLELMANPELPDSIHMKVILIKEWILENTALCTVSRVAVLKWLASVKEMMMTFTGSLNGN